MRTLREYLLQRNVTELKFTVLLVHDNVNFV